MEFSIDPTDEQVAAIDRGLSEHNAGLASARTVVRVRGVFVEAGQVVAGVVAAAYWGKLHISLLWVHPDHRSKGLGRRLMGWAEERGRELGCASAMVNTMSFQAPDFYARLGYRCFGQSDEYEGGASRYYFEKCL